MTEENTIYDIHGYDPDGVELSDIEMGLFEDEVLHISDEERENVVLLHIDTVDEFIEELSDLKFKAEAANKMVEQLDAE